MTSKAAPAEGDVLRTTLSVVIPTYLRPEWLGRAVQSLAGQERVPDEVIAVARATDHGTLAAIEALRRGGLPFPLVAGVVTAPGFMPPVQEGFRLASGDIVAVMDDDAEAEPGWTTGILRHYDNDRVGAVGGRAINVADGMVVPVPTTKRVGYVDLFGRFIGKMYFRPEFSEAVPVQFLMGGCMSFRATLARSLEFDYVLNGNVAFGYEVDLGLQVRRLGWRILFDPKIAIRHYSAPRLLDGMRTGNVDAARGYAFNHLRVILRRLPPARRAVAAFWQVFVGERRAPGLCAWALGPIARAAGFEISVARAAFEGRRAAFASIART